VRYERELDLAGDEALCTKGSPPAARRRDRTGNAGPGVQGEHQREALSGGKKLQPPCDVVERLEAEWPALATGPVQGRLRCWAKEEEALAGFATAQQLIRHLRSLRGRGDAEDAILAALVRQAGGDPLAARVVLQALLPGLKNLAGRLLLEPDERDEIWSALLAHGWERIRRYPLERRPTRIAANVLLDTLQRTTRELKRQRRNRRELAGDLSPQQPANPAASDVEQVLRHAVAATAISDEEAELILRTRIDRTDLRVLAHELQVPYNTLVVRRLRAEKRLLLFLGRPAVTSQASEAPLSSARVVGAGLTGSAGRGAATDHTRRR